MSENSHGRDPSGPGSCLRSNPSVSSLPACDPSRNGARPLPFDRDTLGRMVREAWVRWALTQPAPKSSWLLPYDELAEPDREADRQIGETVARWTLVGDAANLSMLDEAVPQGIEARSDETSGSAEGESPVGREADAPVKSTQTDEVRA